MISNRQKEFYCHWRGAEAEQREQNRKETHNLEPRLGWRRGERDEESLLLLLRGGKKREKSISFFAMEGERTFPPLAFTPSFTPSAVPTSRNRDNLAAGEVGRRNLEEKEEGKGKGKHLEVFFCPQVLSRNAFPCFLLPIQKRRERTVLLPQLSSFSLPSAG